MKCWMLVLMTSFLITSCLTEETQKVKLTKKERELLKKKADLIRYVTNWDKYQIPRPVTVVILKDVLEKIALYRQNLYCPFGKNECNPQQYALPEIIREIVKNSVADPENNKNTTLEDDVELKANKTEDVKKGKKIVRTIRTMQFHTPYSEIDFNDMKRIMTYILELGSWIHNKSMESALKTLELVFGVRWDFEMLADR